MVGPLRRVLAPRVGLDAIQRTCLVDVAPDVVGHVEVVGQALVQQSHQQSDRHEVRVERFVLLVGALDRHRRLFGIERVDEQCLAQELGWVLTELLTRTSDWRARPSGPSATPTARRCHRRCSRRERRPSRWDRPGAPLWRRRCRERRHRPTPMKRDHDGALHLDPRDDPRNSNSAVAGRSPTACIPSSRSPPCSPTCPAPSVSSGPAGGDRRVTVQLAGGMSRMRCRMCRATGSPRPEPWDNPVGHHGRQRPAGDRLPPQVPDDVDHRADETEQHEQRQRRPTVHAAPCRHRDDRSGVTQWCSRRS